ncbi:NUDIX domain-containing protein [Parvularcula sp. LCG005]|uniref:NUDIX domain-containing protein n=1 Tax=Parvularcula sp. LCG005 TaxID=3078805 RepID=UPI002941CB6E|nr:NUDIX domain-containing protein [Parvularcula sp. LCG005]WOI53202.1 NUDIX domain-containing protein [Parvularcula sp. LCG005]
MTIKDRFRLLSEDILAEVHYTYKQVSFEWQRQDGSWQKQDREVLDRGHGAAILPYDPARSTVLLIRQFRYPAFEAGYDGLLIEAAAGLLDDADPETRIRLEAEEELGYSLHDVQRVFTSFMSPGSVTEQIHFFISRYDPSMKTSAGGGKADEGEDIDVLEMSIEDAMDMVRNGQICDAKTIMLLQHAALTIFA